MTIKLRQLFVAAITTTALASVATSCIKDELPGINVDITEVKPNVMGSGIVKTTIQENGVSLYADMKKVNLKNLPLSISLSRNATSEYVDVKFDTTFTKYNVGTADYPIMIDVVAKVDTIITKHTGDYTDFSETRYVKVMAEAQGINPDDKATLSSFSKFGGIDPETGRLYKIWSVQVLPANIPTLLTFDSWYSPNGRDYVHPCEWVEGEGGKMVQSNVWASTNNSLSIMVTIAKKSGYTMPYGAASTTDAVKGNALLLTTNDIRSFDQKKPYVSGCMFLGEFDGTDNNELTCTHVGLPFTKKPKTLKFYYKYLPQVIQATGKLDQGLIRAVLYKTSTKVPYLTGKNILDNDLDNVVAYADLYPNEMVTNYTLAELPFIYKKNVSAADLENWDYNLALYFASSKDGFTFVGGAYSMLYIDEMEIVCE